ncbi:MAG: uracil-DNA glycosylase family protein [Chloroflexota bacterium]
MIDLLNEIKACEVCKPALLHAPRPVLAATIHSKVMIIGQAPGRKVHESGTPWADKSGKVLRSWLNVNEDQFYNADNFAIIPMGFCYPGRGKSGDLPPRPECAPLWHPQLLEHLGKVKLTLLIGQYAQRYYLGKSAKRNLTETVRNFEDYLPRYSPLPHPSPRNRFWLRKNPWYQAETLPKLQLLVAENLGRSA